jgi:hypothetical protein
MPQRFQQQYRSNTATTRKFSPRKFSTVESIKGRTALGKAFVYFPKQFTRKNYQRHKIYRKTPYKANTNSRKSKTNRQNKQNKQYKTKQTKKKKSRTIH